MKVSLTLLFSLTFTIFVHGCPEPACPITDLPTVDKGKIIVTVFYNNDAYSSTAKPNTDFVKIVCNALDAFGDELEAHFKVGGGCKTPDRLGVKPFFECPGDRNQDCQDACVAKLIRYFPTHLCCNKRGRDLYQCAADQGLQSDAIDACARDKDFKVCEEVLLGNSSLRRDAGLEICQLPAVLYNGKADLCSKFKNNAEFIKILCGIFRRGNMTPGPCRVP